MVWKNPIKKIPSRHKWSQMDHKTKMYLMIIYARWVSEITIVIGFFIILYLLITKFW